MDYFFDSSGFKTIKFIGFGCFILVANLAMLAIAVVIVCIIVKYFFF